MQRTALCQGRAQSISASGRATPTHQSPTQTRAPSALERFGGTATGESHKPAAQARGITPRGRRSTSSQRRRSAMPGRQACSPSSNAENAALAPKSAHARASAATCGLQAWHPARPPSSHAQHRTPPAIALAMQLDATQDSPARVVERLVAPEPAQTFLPPSPKHAPSAVRERHARPRRPRRRVPLLMLKLFGHNVHCLPGQCEHCRRPTRKIAL